MLKFFKKNGFGGCKSQIFFIGDENAGHEERRWKFGNIARGTEAVLWGLKIILQIGRLGGHFCRAHGASAPLPSHNSQTKMPECQT